MLKNKFKFTNVSRFELALRLVLYFLCAGIGATLLLLIWFLYKNFYLTLTQTGELVILKSRLAIETLDVVLYQKVKTQEEARLAMPAVEWNKIKNPFGQLK